MKSKVAQEFVERSVWGQLLTPEQLHRVLNEVRERSVPGGAVICHTGNPVLYWKGIIDGLVKMSVVSPGGRTSTLTGLAAGAWFGEGPVLRSATWDFDGVAMRETRFVIDQLNERLAQFLSVIEAERLEVAETRVARCLAWLFNPVLYPGVGLRLDLTQQEIGYLSGVSRQRVNSALQIMSAAGLLDVGYGVVHVLDLAALKRFRA